jgi:succinoglycan biosynthesis protein ExoM
MHSKPIIVDICIATFKRAELLAELLQSIARQKLDGSIVPKLIIVDNDRLASAQQTVESIRADYPFSIVYDLELEQNIALARNRCLSHAGGDIIVFVDDDEFVEENWLGDLIKTLLDFNADVVLGPVLPILDVKTPGWIIRGGFMERPRFRTGTIRNSGAAGNAAVKRSVFSEFAQPFDPRYGLSGGEDHDFFDRIIRKGGKLVWCDSAIAHEHVPASRLTVKFFVMRAFRGGQSFSSVALPQLPIRKRFIKFFYRILLSLISLVLVVLSMFIGKVLFVKALEKLFANIGQLSAFTRYRYKEYAESGYADK